MHDDSALSPKPSVQMRNTRNTITLLNDSVRSSLNQMLSHVPFEVGQQLHLLFQARRVVHSSEIRLFAFLIDEVDIATK